MSKPKIKSIGTVIPLGDGATGKSLLTKHLIKDIISKEEILFLARKIKKSLNIELEYNTKTIEFSDRIVDTTLQYYVFPGQRQKDFIKTPSFEDIFNIFEFLPALKNVTVLLMVFDSTRLESLKSLEFWLKAAIDRDWVSYRTKIILVCTKIDLQEANQAFIDKVIIGIRKMLLDNGIDISSDQISNINISSISLEGISELKNEVFQWVAYFGLQKVFKFN